MHARWQQRAAIQNGVTHKDIRSQAIDLSARWRRRWKFADVQEGIPRHPVAGGVEAPGRAAGESWGDGAVAERVVGGKVHGQGVDVAGGGVRRGSPGLCRVEELSAL